MPRLVPPPRPLAWCEAAASCLRENAVAASLGGSFADGSAEVALECLRARVRVWPSLKISATGPQAERDRALEVLAGAGYVEGWSPGATGKMRARMPAEHEDAPEDANVRDQRLPDRSGDAQPGLGARLRAACDLGAMEWETERESVEALMHEAADLLERPEPPDHYAAVLRFLRHELARFERHHAEGVKVGDSRVGKLATWASLTRTYIAQISRGDHLQIPEEHT